MADPAVEETRKSTPLYRDLSGSRCTAVRAKHLNDKVDAKFIAMSLIKDMSVYNAQKLAEFALTRQVDKLLGEVESKSFFDGSKLVGMNILMHLILTGQ
jgi:hypothetical protein